MTHEELVHIAKRWLWKRCVVVVTEMKISYENEIVDAIGWDWGGWSTVIECKVSRSDFLREKKKRSHREKDGMGNEKYYLVPQGLLTTDEIPEGWGLIEAVDKRRTPKVVRHAVKDMDINPKYAKEILLLVSCLRRIGGLREGVSVRCYQFESKNRATLGIQEFPRESP